MPLTISQGREIGAEHNSGDNGRKLQNQVFEVRVQFRGPTRYVNRIEATVMRKVHYLIDGLAAHHFPTVGTRFEVTVAARLVAEQANIDLQGMRLGPDQVDAL